MRHAYKLSPRPRNLRRLRRVHADQRVQDRVRLLAVLRQLRSIRRSTSQAVLLSLVVSLVLSHLDYGNATLANLATSSTDYSL